MHFLRDRTAHTTTFDGLVVDHLLEQKIAQTANAPILCRIDWAMELTQMGTQPPELPMSQASLCITYSDIKGQFLSYHAYMVWEVKDS